MKTMNSSAGPAIASEDLSKTYREVRAVDGLNLSVRRGEIYGFLGRNGAGKTTTIRMLLGLIRPTRGRVWIDGHAVGAERARAVAAAGSLVESATFYPNLTVRENLDMQRRLTGAGRGDVEQALALLNLTEFAYRRAGRLSLGNKQRLALARALLPHPRLLVLDEPANALDPAGIVEIRNLLRRLADEGRVTVFVSSHILGENQPAGGPDRHHSPRENGGGIRLARVGRRRHIALGGAGVRRGQGRRAPHGEAPRMRRPPTRRSNRRDRREGARPTGGFRARRAARRGSGAGASRRSSPSRRIWKLTFYV